MAPPSAQPPSGPRVVEGRFDDIDALAASALEWDQEYEQLGRGPFQGRLTQVLLGNLQLGRESWSPGVLQRGTAPAGTWMFGLPLAAAGSLHARQRPLATGEMLAATCDDDIGFTATGPAELMMVVLPTARLDAWTRARHSLDNFDSNLRSRRWQLRPADMAQRALALAQLLETLAARPQDFVGDRALTHVEEHILSVTLATVPSADAIEPLHSRARIARSVFALFHERLDDPPSVSELCVAVAAKERTLHLSCVEAFGRPPATLLAELRLNAARRSLLRPDPGTSVTAVSAQYGFAHFGRFAEFYRRQFGEVPSATLFKARGAADRTGLLNRERCGLAEIGLAIDESAVG